MTKSSMASRRHTTIKALLIDLDGTLYQSARYSRALGKAMDKTLAELLEVDVDSARTILAERKKVVGTVTRSLESLGVNRRTFFQNLSINIDPNAFLRPNRTRSKTLRYLRRKKLKMALVSNSGRPLVTKILRALRISPKLFDAVVTSDEAEPKPSLQSYRVCLNLLSTNPRVAAYVGDRSDIELKPAKKLGLVTILVASSGRSDGWADYVIRRFSDLPRLLQTMEQGHLLSKHHRL